MDVSQPEVNVGGGRYFTFEARGLAIELTTEIRRAMELHTKETLKPFGGNLPEGFIVLPANWKELFYERFERDFLGKIAEEDDPIKALRGVTIAVAKFIQGKYGWTHSRSCTFAIEYVLSTLAMPYSTDVLDVGEYCRIVGEYLKPAYKALHAARILTQPNAFELDWNATLAMDGRKTSKREINNAAVEAFYTIERWMRTAHVGMFRHVLNDVFPVFESERTWKALRNIMKTEIRHAMIGLLKKRIAEYGPVITLTDVTVATSRVLTNQALANGVPTGVSMDAFFTYLKGTHGERIIDAKDSSFKLRAMPVESFMDPLRNTYGFVSSAQIERVNGSIEVRFVLRDMKDDAAAEIGVPVDMRTRRRPPETGTSCTAAI